MCRRALAVVAPMALVAGLAGCRGSAIAPREATTAWSVPVTPVSRATGPGACAFLSLDDVRQLTGAAEVMLASSLGPSGKPGCEWKLGDARAVLQLEFQVGSGLVATGGGEEVTGPWRSARWNPDNRTLSVDRGDLMLIVRVTDADVRQAKAISTRVATLATIRA